MTIRFLCTCGQELVAREEYAGRQVRCSGCNTVQAVPAPGSPSPEGIGAAPVSRPIVFACACGQQCEIGREHAGETTSCPRCGNVVRIPSGPDVHSTGGQTPSRRTTPLVWGAAGVFGLVALGAVVWLLFFRAAEVTAGELAPVPHDAQGFLTVKVADLLSSPAGDRLLKHLGPDNDVFRRTEGLLGIHPSEVDRLTIVWPTTDETRLWVFVRMTKPFDLARVRQARETRERWVRNKMYLLCVSQDLPLAVHALDDRTVVVATEDGMRLYFDWPARPRGRPLEEGIKLASQPRFRIAGSIQLSREAREIVKRDPRFRQPVVNGLLDFQTASFGSEVSDGLKIEGQALFPDADLAENALATIEQLKGVAGFALLLQEGQIRKEIGPAAEPVLAFLRQLLNVKPTREGDRLTAQLAIEPADLNKMIDGLIQALQARR